jgi:dephospho-CoA kinase
MKIIGIAGKARSGKNTFASLIADDLVQRKGSTVCVDAFANSVRDTATALFQLKDELYNDDLKEVEDPFWGITYRKMLQLVGTEVGRSIDQDIWIKNCIKKLKTKLVSSDVVIYADLRFENEADWIRDNGGLLIHIVRHGADGNVGIEGHSSENGVDIHDRDVLIYNDGSIDDLDEKVSEIVDILESYKDFYLQ